MGIILLIILFAHGLGCVERSITVGALQGHRFKDRRFTHSLGRKGFLQILVFATIWLFSPSLHNLALATLLSLSLCGSKLDLARNIVPDGIPFLGIFLGFGFLLSGALNRETCYILLPSQWVTLLINGEMDILLTSATLLWIGIIFEFFTGRDGLGFGDIKFAGMMGLYLGWTGSLHAIFYGAWSALIWIVLRKVFFQKPIHDRHPFIPHLTVGMGIHILRQILG
jgi:prepilin signal peptidase PulO-like enzyme (type II secretory pathway)